MINVIKSRLTKRPASKSIPSKTFAIISLTDTVGYTSKHAITSADLLNDRVLPFFEHQKIPVLRMLADRGTEFNWRPENHEYELYLQLENIDHSKTKVRHPKINGICERLHLTMQD